MTTTATFVMSHYSEDLDATRRLFERALRSVNAQQDTDWQLAIVDDASPDGTGELADRLADKLGYVDVLHRPRKEGLGPAYLAGFRHALARGAERILEMDCDFSHDPADVPRLLEATDDADLAIGSRYVPGGQTKNWGVLRRAISAGGSLYARFLLSVAIRHQGLALTLVPRSDCGCWDA